MKTRQIRKAILDALRKQYPIQEIGESTFSYKGPYHRARVEMERTRATFSLVSFQVPSVVLDWSEEGILSLSGDSTYFKAVPVAKKGIEALVLEATREVVRPLVSNEDLRFW